MPAKRGPEPKGKVYPRPGKKYQAQITIDGRCHSLTFSNKAGAQAYLSRMRSLSRRSDRVDQQVTAENLTLGGAIQARFDALSARFGPKSDPCAQLRRLRDYLGPTADLRLNDIVPADIADFRDERLVLGDAPATVCGHISRISTTFRWVEEKMSPGLDNPALRVSRPKESDGPSSVSEKVKRSLKKKRLTPVMEKALMDSAVVVQDKKRSFLPFFLLLQFAIETTMRRGEIAAMSWDDIDWIWRRISIPHTKNGEERTASVWPSTIALLEQLDPQDDGRVWASVGTISNTWREVRAHAADTLEQQGKKAVAKRLSAFRFHDLRFEGVCRLFEYTDLTEREIASITGHKTPAMLWHYARNLRTESTSVKLAKAQGKDWEPPKLGAASEPDRERIPAISPEWRHLSRDYERLLAAVWSRPIRDVAWDMGVSDVAVHRACARLGVKKPPRGYWLERERRLAA